MSITRLLPFREGWMSGKGKLILGRSADAGKTWTVLDTQGATVPFISSPFPTDANGCC